MAESNKPTIFDKWSEAAKAGDLAGAILAYVECYDHVTFAELDRRMESFFEMKGDAAVFFERDPNLLVWVNMSEEFADTVVALRDEKRLRLEPTEFMTYMIDGAVLKLPVAKKPPSKGYKKPHWLPVCLRLGRC